MVNENAKVRIDQGDFEGAIESLESGDTVLTRSLEHEYRADLAGLRAGIRWNLGSALSIQGGLHSGRGEFSKSKEYCKRAIEILRGVEQAIEKGSSGADQSTSEVLCVSLSTYAHALAALGQYVEAERYYEEAQAIFTRLIQEHGREDLEDKLALLFIDRGASFLLQRDFDRAVGSFSKAVDILTQAVERKGQSVLLEKLASALASRAGVFLQRGNAAEAVRDYEKAIQIFTQFVERQGRVDLRALRDVLVSRLAVARKEAQKP
jgi:tetratricopeptide (TPR) repeat protein